MADVSSCSSCSHRLHQRDGHRHADGRGNTSRLPGGVFLPFHGHGHHVTHDIQTFLRTPAGLTVAQEDEEEESKKKEKTPTNTQCTETEHVVTPYRDIFCTVPERFPKHLATSCVPVAVRCNVLDRRTIHNVSHFMQNVCYSVLSLLCCTVCWSGKEAMPKTRK